jgi:hypothetical protein
MLRARYDAQLREYQQILAKVQREADEAAARPRFVDIPFKPEIKRGPDRDVIDSSRGMEAHLRQDDLVSESSSDTEAEGSDDDRDVIIDPKKRLQRHRGQVKAIIPTTPVKSAAAVTPSTTPNALGRDAVEKLLKENGFPYIFVPRVADIQDKEPIWHLKQYFKGCLDVSNTTS